MTDPRVTERWTRSEEACRNDDCPDFGIETEREVVIYWNEADPESRRTGTYWLSFVCDTCGEEQDDERRHDI